MEKNIIPTIGSRAFVCPHCHAFAQQEWSTVFLQESKMNTVSEKLIPNLGKYLLFNDFFVSKCLVCRQPAIWHNKKIIYPECSSVPVAHELMPKDVKMIYEEAGAIYNKSYKAAAALLRLALQILLKNIGGKGKKIDDDIRDLFEKRIIREDTKNACDIVRVLGNNAVHPGQIDLNEQPETVSYLFNLLNFVVEDTIERPTKISALYKTLPEGQREAIKKRDGD